MPKKKKVKVRDGGVTSNAQPYAPLDGAEPETAPEPETAKTEIGGVTSKAQLYRMLHLAELSLIKAVRVADLRGMAF